MPKTMVEGFCRLRDFVQLFHGAAIPDCAHKGHFGHSYQHSIPHPGVVFRSRRQWFRSARQWPKRANRALCPGSPLTAVQQIVRFLGSC